MQKLDKIQAELQKVAEHVAQYSGVDRRQALMVDTMGDGSAKTVVRDVRRALGYTVP